MQELNSDVNGDYVDDNIDNLIKNTTDFFKNFNVVIATSISEKTTVSLSNLLWDMNIPLIVCKSIGMIGIIRVQINDICIVETHPDNRQRDLRLDNPFPALKEHMDSTELSSKIPWLVVLYKFMEKWRAENDNRIPKAYKEKAAIRDMIKSAITAEEENYEEAVKAVNSSFGGGLPDSHMWNILNDNKCVNLNKNSTAFWIIARAIRDFVDTEGNGYLPVPAILPDMTADTASYINLQNVYRTKALNDADYVYRRAQEIAIEFGRPSDLINEREVKLFCREAAHIAYIRGQKISEQYDHHYKSSCLGNNISKPDSLIRYYVALRALDKFETEHGYIPGACQVETDTARIKHIGSRLLNEWGLNSHLSDDLAHEICRYGGAEIHSVSAFLGGCVAHEVIKIVTRQYKPLQNTFIYDAISSQTASFVL